MMFMNRWEIQEARQQFLLHPVLGPATETLDNLRRAADANSDGWAYWPKPARAARKLQELIQQGEKWQRERYQSPRTPEPTAAEYRKALGPVKAFRTRARINFNIVEV